MSELYVLLLPPAVEYSALVFDLLNTLLGLAPLLSGFAVALTSRGKLRGASLKNNTLTIGMTPAEILL